MRRCSVRHILPLALSVVLLSQATVHAQDPVGCVDSLTSEELDYRLDLLDQHFQTGKRRIRLWWYGWMSVFGALGVGQVALALTADEQVDRFSNAVGATGAFLTAIQLAILPQVAAYAPQRYRRMPDATLEERRAKLRYGLDRLRLGAAREERVAGPGAHLVPVLWSGTWATVIMRKFDSPLTVLRLVGGGFLITEARILSTPSAAVESWEYLRGTMCGHTYVHRPNEMEMEDLPGPAEPSGPTARITPTFTGLHLNVTF